MNARTKNKLIIGVGLSCCILVGHSAVFSGSKDAQGNSPVVDEILQLEADLDYGEYLSGECASCHNPNGDAAASVPVIHGADKSLIVKGLVEYRDGTRDNTTMKGVAGNLSNDEIAAIAAYLASVNSAN